MPDAPWQQIDVPYVVRSSALTTVAGGLLGLFLGGIIRGRKPAQYAIWIGANAAAGSALFFSIQEVIAIARRRDDFLNSAVAGFFAGYIVSIKNATPTRARVAALATSTLCSLGHAGVSRLADSGRVFEANSIASVEPIEESDPGWLPVHRIDADQLQEMQERSERISLTLPPQSQ